MTVKSKPVGIGTGGVDPRQMAEIAALEEELAQQAAGSVGDSSTQQPTAPQLPKKVDRAGATGVMSQQPPRIAPMAPPVPANDIEGELLEKMRKLGYVPQSGTVTRPQFEAAAQKFVKEHKNDLAGVQDVDDLFALLDRLIAEDNAKHNKAPAWNGQSPAQRSGMLPSGSTYANQGPSPNSGALQSQASQAIATAHPPPPAGSVNARIAEAAKNYMGTSTAAGPDHGNLACAWSVNNILSNAGLQKVGSNPNYVPSVEQALQSGRGTAVSAQDAKPGDIVIFPGGHHIGIYMGDGKVANNSSSHAAFVNLSSLQGGMHIYRVNS